MIESVACMQRFYHNVNRSGKLSKKTKVLDFVLNNMRMSLCELG